MICPYCGHKINKHKMLLYFSNAGREGIGNLLDKASGSISDIVMKHNQGDSNYKRYWDSRNDQNVLKGENGIVVDQNKLLQALDNNPDSVIRTEDKEEIAVHIDPDDPNNTYFHPNVTRPVKAEAFLCPYCWNFFPKNYFQHDSYTILLVAPTSTGKSVYSTALLANGCQRISGSPNRGRQESLDGLFDSTLCETLQRDLANDIRAFEAVPHRLPSETKKAVPPIFLTFTLHRPGKEDYIFNLSLVDTKGEGWVKRDPQVTAFLDSCDGVLYLTEPRQSTELIKNAHPQADAPIVNRLDPQDNRAEPGRPANPKMRNASAQAEADPTQEKEKEVVGAARIIYDYFQHTDGPIEFDTPIAFVLTKFDQLIDETQYCLPEGTEPLFFEQLKEFHDPAFRNVLLNPTELIVHTIAAKSLFQKVFPELNLSGHYHNVNCFCTSSFTGEPGGDRTLTNEQFKKTYHIHLPFLWLLSQIIDPDGTRSDKRERREEESSEARYIPQETAYYQHKNEMPGRRNDNAEPKKSTARMVNETIADD